MANFVLYGKEPGVMGGYREGIATSYLPRTLQEELLKAQLANKYYGPDIESQMALRGAQGNLANANAYLHQQQGNWVGPQAQAGIGHIGYQNRLLGEQVRGVNRTNTINSQLDELNRRIMEEMGNSQAAAMQNQVAPNGQQIGQLTQGPTLQQTMVQQAQGINPSMPDQQEIIGNPTLDNLLRQRDFLMGINKKSGANNLEEKLNFERAKQDIKGYEKIGEVAKVRADASNGILKQLENLKLLSDQLNDLESGPGLGKLPAISSTAQEFEKTVATIIKEQADSMKGQGVMSKFKLQMIERMKPSRTMNSQARQNVINMIGAMASRSAEESPFFSLAESNGINHKDAESLWNLYDKERPEYNPKDHSINNQNLNSFSDYMTPKALYAAKQGKSYDPRKNEQANEMIEVISANGIRGRIPKNRLEDAIKRGARTI